MAGGLVRHLILAGFTATLVAGCMPGSDKDTPKDAEPKPLLGLGKSKSQGQEVEAPEVFQTTDMALWDGRPSLGGVWVAAPEAKDPERVIIRNTENGKSVVGALFRRERELPGPRLQLSSDAAAAIGLLAGQPGKVSVTALRRQEAAAEASAETTAPAAATTAAAAAAAPEVKAAPATTKPPAEPAAPAPAAPAAAPAAAPSAAGAPIPAGTIAERPIAAPQAAPAKAAPATKAAPAKGAQSVRIGTFSQEANAKAAAKMLGDAGIAATTVKGQTDGKDYWLVTATGSDGDALLAKVKGLGFADAYKNN